MADEGKTGGQQIARLEKGNKTRTARHADVMNEIIDAINAIRSMTVVPPEKGEFFWSDANGVLLLNAGGGCGDTEPPSSGTFVCGSVDGVKQWIETSDCSGIDGGEA